MTPEEIAKGILRWAYGQDRDFGSTLDIQWTDQITAALRAYGDERAAEMRERAEKRCIEVAIMASLAKRHTDDTQHTTAFEIKQRIAEGLAADIRALE